MTEEKEVLVPVVMDEAKEVMQGKSLLPFNPKLTPQEQLSQHVELVGRFSVVSNLGRNAHLWQLGTMHRVMNTTPSTYGYDTREDAPTSLNAIADKVGTSAATVMRGRDLVENFVSEEVFRRYLPLPTAYLLESVELPSPLREDCLDDIMKAYEDEDASVTEAAEAMREEISKRKEAEKTKEEDNGKIKELPVNKLRKHMERVNDIVQDLDENPDDYVWNGDGINALAGQMDGLKETHDILEGLVLVKRQELGGKGDSS